MWNLRNGDRSYDTDIGSVGYDDMRVPLGESAGAVKVLKVDVGPLVGVMVQSIFYRNRNDRTKILVIVLTNDIARYMVVVAVVMGKY